MDECHICLEDLTGEIAIISCGHKFHYKCIDEWLETNTKCPICRFCIEDYCKEINEI